VAVTLTKATVLAEPGTPHLHLLRKATMAARDWRQERLTVPQVAAVAHLQLEAMPQAPMQAAVVTAQPHLFPAVASLMLAVVAVRSAVAGLAP
jgi:hypothetical protein